MPVISLSCDVNNCQSEADNTSCRSFCNRILEQKVFLGLMCSFSKQFLLDVLHDFFLLVGMKPFDVGVTFEPRHLLA